MLCKDVTDAKENLYLALPSHTTGLGLRGLWSGWIFSKLNFTERIVLITPRASPRKSLYKLGKTGIAHFTKKKTDE